MITMFVGIIGSGKSYDAVRKLIDNLKLGREIFTNIEGMDEPEHRLAIQTLSGLSDYEMETKLHFLEDWKIKEFWKHITPKSLIFIDEVHKHFNSRDWGSQQNRDCANWCSTSRHSGNDLILITQAVDKIDKQIRDLVGWTYVYRKNTFMGKLFKNMYIQYSYPDSDTSSKPLGSNNFSYDPKIYMCYKSYQTKAIREQGIMKYTNILMHPVFFVIPILLAVCIYMIFFKSSLGTGDLFGLKDSQALQTAAIEKHRKANPVPVYGLDKSGKSHIDVAKDKAIQQVAYSVAPSDPAENARLAEIEQKRINALHALNNYYEDDQGIRHYLNGDKIKVVYVERSQ